VLAGYVLGSLAGVGRFAARVADRLEERLVVRPAETPEDRPGRAVLLQLLHAGDHDGWLAVVHVEAVVGGALPVPLGQLGQLRDDGVGIARADAVEDAQQRRHMNDEPSRLQLLHFAGLCMLLPAMRPTSPSPTCSEPAYEYGYARPRMPGRAYP
jgi:hypothetical protein